VYQLRATLMHLKKMKSAVVSPRIVDSAFSPSLYVYTVHNTHWKLYRIRVP
jgi:hypothetical protein